MKHTATAALILLGSIHAHAEDRFDFKVQLLAIDANEGVAVADYDNDGWLDVSAGRSWYRNPGGDDALNAWVPRPLRIIEDRGGYAHTNGEHAHDVDGDGWIDVVSNSFWLPEVHWYKNPGEQGLKRGQLWKQNLLFDSGQKTNELCQLIDIDAADDGKPEYFANQWNKNQPSIIWRQDESGEYVGHTIGPKSGHGIGFGDLNNDGRDDVIFGNGWYERPEGDPYAKPWTYHDQWSLSMSCPMQVRDVNGDGKNDLIWGKGHDFGVFAWISKGIDDNGKFLYDEVKIDNSFSQAHALHFADLDGDGKDELITGKRVFGHNGRDPGANDTPVVMAYTWNDGFTNIEKHVLAESVGIGLHIRTADFDQDGDLDIVVPGKEGTQILWNQRK
jgi:hypothetical protein